MPAIKKPTKDVCKQYNIIIIEDDAGLNKALVRLLNRELGCVTEGYTSGKEAISKIPRSAKAILVLDYKLGDMDCIEFLEKMKNEGIDHPFIIVTGYGDESIAVELMKQGARDYLVKDTKFIDVLPRVIGNLISDLEQEKKLSETEERYRILAETARDTIFILNTSQKITYINRFGASLVGKNPEEIIGRHVSEIFEKGNFARQRESLESVMKDGSPGYWEDVFEFPDKTLWLGTWLTPAVDENGSIKEIIGISRDITSTKKTEEELKETTALLESLFDAIPDVLGVQDAKHGLIQYNKAGYDFVQRTHKEVIGKKCFEMIGRETPCEVCATSEVYRTLKPAQVEKFVEELGTWLDVRAYPVLNEKGELVQVIEHLRDISYEKEQEEAVLQSERKFRGIFEQSTQGIHLIGPDMTIIDWNKGSEEITGLKAEDVVGKPIFTVMSQLMLEERRSPERMDMVKGAMTDFQGAPPEFGTRTSHIYPIRRSDGEIRIVENLSFTIESSEGNILCGIMHDLTDLKNIEKDLQSKIEELITFNIITNQATTTLSIEEMTRNVLFEVAHATESDAAVLYLNKDDELELIGINPEKRGLDNEDEPILGIGQCLCSRALLGTPIFSIDVAKDDRIEGSICGTDRYASFTALPLLRDESVIGVLGLASGSELDYENQREFLETIANQISVALQNILLHSEVMNQAEELEERVSERTEELEAFAYSVSHDLRAPLRAMEGFSTALLEDYGEKLDDMGKEYAQRIVSSAHRMDLLIQDILVYSRISRAEMTVKDIDLSDLLDDVKEEIESTIRETGADVKVMSELPHIRSHEQILHQTFLNLITNAIKYVEPDQKPVIEIWHQLNEDSIEVYFKDNGIGIDEKYHERIFKIFERLHGLDKYPGTGIGLAVVKKGLEKIGGDVAVASDPGKGSTFWITIPY